MPHAPGHCRRGARPSHTVRGAGEGQGGGLEDGALTLPTASILSAGPHRPPSDRKLTRRGPCEGTQQWAGVQQTPRFLPLHQPGCGSMARGRAQQSRDAGLGPTRTPAESEMRAAPPPVRAPYRSSENWAWSCRSGSPRATGRGD